MTIEIEKRGYSSWLFIFIPMAMLSLFNAGFDHDVLFAVATFLAGILLYYMINSKRHVIHLGPIVFSYSMFLFYTALSIFWSIFPIRTLIEWVQLVCFGLMLVVTSKVEKEGIDKLFISLFLVSFGVSLLGILEYVLIKDRRIQSTFTNPNPFGMYVSMIFLLAHGLSLRKQSKGMVVLSVFFLTTLLLTGSRAAIAAMGIGLVVAHFNIRLKSLPKALLKTGYTVVGALVSSQLLLYLSRFIQENFSFNLSVLNAITRSGSFVTSSLAGRLEFWRVAMNSFTDRPVAGYGLGTFFSSYYLHYGGNGWYSRFTHNHYLQILAELGAIGGVLFLGFLVVSFMQIIKRARSSQKSPYFWGMCGAMLAFLAHISVDFTWNFPAVTMLFFLFLGLATRSEQVFERAKIEESADMDEAILADADGSIQYSNNSDATSDFAAGVVDIIQNESRPKWRFHLPKLVGVCFLVFFLLLVGWQYAASQFFLHAISTEKAGDVTKALDVTQQVNRFFPISTFGQEYESDLLTKKYMETKDEETLKNAFHAAENAMRLSPFDAGQYARKANLYLLMGNDQMAEKCFLDAIDLSTYHIRNDQQLGRFYVERGMNEKAIAVFQTALERVPEAFSRVGDKEILEQTANDVAVTRIMLYQLYQEKGDDELAQEQIDELNQLVGKYPSLAKYFTGK